MSVLLTASTVRVEFGSLVAVRDVSFELGGGQLVGLVGPNGAGKTTLLRVLAGLHAPTCGVARIMGHPVLGHDEVVRRHVGFAPDTPPAYEDLTIHQFLMFIGRAYDLSDQETEERMAFWLDQLWLAEKRHIKIKHLSRGMRQRVTLARTFLPNPHVLLLDEPLAGIDPGGRIQLRRVLSMLRAQQRAMIVSSHILADLEEVATHIAILERGSIVRWSDTATLHHHQDHRRTYKLTTLNGGLDVAEIIAAFEGTSNIRNDGPTYVFDYHAEEQKAVELLRQLILRDVPVLSFTWVKQSLEEVYLQAGVKQVD